LNFGSEGGLKTNSPEDQVKAIVYNELVANAVAVQTVADQTQALHQLRRRGIEIAAEDLAHFSPYPTNRVKRFGEYPARTPTEIQPPNKHLPRGSAAASTSGASSLDSTRSRGQLIGYHHEAADARQHLSTYRNCGPEGK
jgi:hypothetical protein